MNEKFIKINNLSVDKTLADFINNELLKDTGISPDKFWQGFDKVIHELAPKNKDLLEVRETLQKEIDLWHKKNKSEDFEIEKYKSFLKEIGYLKEEGPDFKINTQNLDLEISSIAGPQLVVPIMNARYSLNAANARWMSLYDSLYGTDVIESEESGSEKYDPLRGEQVIKYAREFLNKHFPIDGINWKDISQLEVNAGKLRIKKDQNLFDLKNPEMNRYIAVDCAIVGSLSDADLYNLARMLSCTIKQDYKKLANLFISNQWVEQDSDVYDLEMTLKSCCEPIFEKPLAEIEFGKLLLFLFESTRSFGLSIQPSLVLLQKTLIHIEGMGRSIYPKLDFWSIAEPYLDDWIRNKYHPKQLLKYIEENKYEILEKGANLPNDILNILDALKSIADNPQHQNKKVEALKHEISKQQFINRLSLAGFLLLAVLFLINS